MSNLSKYIHKILFISMLLPSTVFAYNQTCALVEDAVILAQDGKNTYLGKISNSYDSDSIFNEYGDYGNEFSSESIWNEYSEFGNEFNSYSPFNEFSTMPPMLIKGGKVIGYLSANEYVSNSISANALKAICKDEF